MDLFSNICSFLFWAASNKLNSIANTIVKINLILFLFEKLFYEGGKINNLEIIIRNSN
jgi:hypothetical protein